jgi:hypothetical protein
MDHSSFSLSKTLKVILVLDLLLVNGMLGFLMYEKFTTPNSPELSLEESVSYVDQCGVECKQYITEQLAARSLSATALPKPTPTPSSVPQVVYKTVAAPKTRSVTYLPITGSGSVSNNDWTGIGGTDFYFNPTDYPGLVEVYFEATIKLFNGNGIAYVRLYDMTHGIGVQGSKIQTASQNSSLVTSGKTSFWSGKNLIRVQAKSLTADTAVFESGRLRIVTEN